MRTIRAVSATLACLVVLAALGAPVAARGPTTRYVDDDGTAGRSGCGGTKPVPRKVQRAIRAAGPGDTVLVCPGRYTEQLTIRGDRDGLTIKAVEPWRAIIRTPRTLTGSRTSLIRIDGVDRVRVRSLRLVIRTDAPCDPLDVGVLVRDAHRVRVRSLRIEPQGLDTIGRCGYLTGIAVEGGASAFIGDNLIRDFTGIGIHIVNSRTTATVYRNSIRFLHAAEPWVEGRGGGSAGILAKARSLVTIRANDFRSGPGAGSTTPILDEGMFLELGDASVVEQNTIHRTRLAGIATFAEGFPAPRAIVRDNVITGGLPGVSYSGLFIKDGSTYSGNRVSGHDFGVMVNAGDLGRRLPTLRDNDFRGNDNLDCWDDFTATGQGGAMSTWIDNLGDTSQPPGICSPAP